MQTTTWHFGRLGAAVGYRPFFFLLFSVVILLPGFYGIIFKRHTHLNIDEGFTRFDAPSRKEIGYQKNFFGANESAIPWYLAIFGVPRFENGSMMEDDEFAELLKVYNKVATELTISGPNGTKMTYQNICKPFCGINQMLIQALTTPPFFVERGYPNFKIVAFNVNVGKFIFDRSYAADDSLSGSKLMVFYFTIFVDSKERKNQLEELDKQAIEVVKAHNSNPNRTVDIILHGNYPVQLEVQRGFEQTMPLIFYGILIGFFTVGLTIMLTAKLFRQCGWQTGIWIFCSIFIVATSIPAALGLTCLFRMPINVLVPMTPFVGISIILNAMILYQMTDIWHRTAAILVKKTSIVVTEAAEFSKKNSGLLGSNSVIYRATKFERMAHLFQQIGRDFLTFFFISILSLIITAYFAIPYYQMIFLFFAFTIFYMSFLQLFFFCPIILLTCRYTPETVQKSSNSNNSNNSRKISFLRKIKKIFSTKIIFPYSKFLQKSFGKLFFLSIFFIGFLCPTIYGIKKLENQMDFRRILPKNSSALKAFGFMDQNVWNDFLQYIFVMNNPPKFDDPNEFGKFKKMLTELENLPQTFGPKSNMMWLYDYFNFELDQNFHKTDVKSVNMSKFRSFITTAPYDAWNDGVKWSIDPATNETKIDSMIFMITFKNVTSLQGKVDTLCSCRKVLSKYPQFDVASFDTDSATVDTILSVPPTLMALILTLIVLTAVVSSFMMQNLIAAFATTIFTISTILGIFGFAYFVGIQVDALGVGTFVYSIMIGLLMVCQTVSTYFRYIKDKNRLSMTLERLGCQTCKLLLLACAITIPVLFSTVTVHLFNIRIVIISIIVSIIHVIFFIPTTLNFFPAPCTGNACFYDSD